MQRTVEARNKRFKEEISNFTYGLGGELEEGGGVENDKGWGSPSERAFES